ncbi:uncharacterized protein LOC128963069 [Oppia nitens]|uniref:uncharacterized protein LOC128963069 n=1 Tax=Oppia nitens TaxID=1686743 RepID=UPI0023DB248F|nr:uncharacterized protein LOC128963069 [Oppia nitens]
MSTKIAMILVLLGLIVCLEASMDIAKRESDGQGDQIINKINDLLSPLFGSDLLPALQTLKPVFEIPLLGMVLTPLIDGSFSLLKSIIIELGKTFGPIIQPLVSPLLKNLAQLPKGAIDKIVEFINKILGAVMQRMLGF